ncbi:MAG: hypothetical protein HXX14_13435 [Bacteroidetes bacterium]|nr:hypothetical protein [Bacteroidota bacterium]
MKKKSIAGSLNSSTICKLFIRNQKWLHETLLLVAILLFLGLIYRIKHTGLFSWLPVGWFADRLILMIRDSSWFIGKYIFQLNVVCRKTFILYFPDPDSSILIYQGCSGFSELVKTAMFFSIYPGALKQKLWFIPVALLFVFAIAVLRMVCLSIAVAYYPNLWDFVHTRLMTFMFYGALFALWVVYVEYVKSV